MHGWYLRFEGDKGLQFAKWCELPFLLGVLTKEEVNEAVDAYEETRSSSHDAALAAWEAEVAAQEEGLAIRAAQARQLFVLCEYVAVLLAGTQPREV